MDYPQRKLPRLKDFDYATPGAYFITICACKKQCLFGHIVQVDPTQEPQMKYSKIGEIACKCLLDIENHYDNVKIDNWVIMPNHIHIMLFVSENGASRTSPPTRQHSAVSHFVSTLKRFCNKECGENIWQRGFYDHVIRNREDYDAIVKYIHENPMRWYYDELYVEE